jgi:hypothetical protein
MLLDVTLGALARRPHEVSGRLFDLDARSSAVDEKRADDQPERDDDRDEHRTERHPGILTDGGRPAPREQLPKNRQ